MTKSITSAACPKEVPTVHGRAKLADGTLTIERELLNGHTITTEYRVEFLKPQSVIADPTIRLHRTDGSIIDIYNVDGYWLCDCWDFMSRRDNIDPDGCKHIRSLRACGVVQ